jgi:hypothetical protein
MKAGVRETFDSEHLATRDHGQQQQATLHRPIRGTALRVTVEQRHGAGSAIPFVAPLFGACQAVASQVLKQSAAAVGGAGTVTHPVDGQRNRAVGSVAPRR